jgi:hypothetical protein
MAMGIKWLRGVPCKSPLPVAGEMVTLLICCPIAGDSLGPSEDGSIADGATIFTTAAGISPGRRLQFITAGWPISIASEVVLGPVAYHEMNVAGGWR